MPAYDDYSATKKYLSGISVISVAISVCLQSVNFISTIFSIGIFNYELYISITCLVFFVPSVSFLGILANENGGNYKWNARYIVYTSLFFINIPYLLLFWC